MKLLLALGHQLFSPKVLKERGLDPQSTRILDQAAAELKSKLVVTP